MDAQAGLRLCCSHPPEDRFSQVEAGPYEPRHVLVNIVYIDPDMEIL